MGLPRAQGTPQCHGSPSAVFTPAPSQAVIFAPEYEPHGVKILYDGEPVELTPAQALSPPPL